MSEKSIKAVCNSTDYNHWGMTDDPSYKQLDEFVAKCVREHKA